MKRFAFFRHTFLLCAAMTVSQAPAQDRPAAASLANAEFAFASHSVATNMKEAFLAVFTDDGYLLQPGPVNAKEATSRNPVPPIELNWRPAYVHVAASGDLGYSTGPARILSKTDPARPPRWTNFVSIWKRDAGGPWRLHVDLGIFHSQPILADAWLQLSAGTSTGPGEAAFVAAEKSFASLAEQSGYAAAFAQHAADDVRVYRNNAVPMLGKSSLGGATFGAAGQGSEIVASGVSKSGDLGWALVKLAPRKDGKLDTASAHALRIWRAREGKFELALDVLNEMPKP
jgi:ketosteroid isomerase-like protein